MHIEDLEPVQEAIANDNVELARNLLRLLIQKYPDSADVWYWSAKAAVNETQSKAFLEKAVALDPLHHQAANDLYLLDHPELIIRSQEIREERQASEKTAHAHFVRRALAFGIDFVIVVIVASMVAGVLIVALLPDFTPAFALNSPMFDDPRLFTISVSLVFGLQAVYHGYFLSQQAGQTLGKMLLKIRVVKRDGSKMSLWEAILRNVVGYQLSLVIPPLGFLWMLGNAESQTWHDMVSDTVVINVE